MPLLLLRERAYSATGNSRVHYLKSGYIIQVIVFRCDTTCICSSPVPSFLFRKWVWFARLTRTYVGMCYMHLPYTQLLATIVLLACLNLFPLFKQMRAHTHTVSSRPLPSLPPQNRPLPAPPSTSTHPSFPSQPPHPITAMRQYSAARRSTHIS